MGSVEDFGSQYKESISDGEGDTSRPLVPTRFNN